jgi:two-component sensor histidine kinase
MLASPDLDCNDPWPFMAEMTHRMANEYSSATAILSRAAARIDNAGARDALEAVAERLHRQAVVHRALLPPFAGPTDLSNYLASLCHTLTDAMLAERGIALRLTESRVELDAERCWRVGLIVTELIVNAVRHGIQADEGGVISVELAVRSDLVECYVIDNGRPLSSPLAGAGSRIVDALAGGMGGTIERRFDKCGTSVLLAFPLAVGSVIAASSVICQ